MVLKPFGFPAWTRTKRRIAKKIINSYGRNIFDRWQQFSTLRVGDLVRTCDGLNSKVVSVEPVYVQVGKGKVLIDLDITTDKTSCSVFHCGVSLPISYEEALSYRDKIIAAWSSNDEWGFAERYSAMTINKDGTWS
ncbi:MAG: hypothetical protein ACWGQW_01485 [bacterium]